MPIHLSFHHWNSTYDWHRRRIGDLSATWGGEFTRCWQNGNGKHPRYPRSFHTDDYTSAFRLGPHKYVSWGNDGYATPDTPLSEHHVVGKSLYRNRYRFIIATSCTRCRKTCNDCQYYRQRAQYRARLPSDHILLIHGGNAIVASFTLVMTVLMFFTMPSSALVQGMQPMVGFHYGAKHMHLVRRSYITAILCSIGVGSLFYLSILLFPQSLFSLFTHDSQLLRLAVPAGHMVLMGLPLLGIQSIGTAYFQSIGKGTPALVLWILRQFILLIPLIYALGSLRGAVGVYWAFPISDIISALVIFFVTARSVSALQQHHRKTSEL